MADLWADIQVEFDAEGWLDEVEIACDLISKEAAEKVQREAQEYLMSHAKSPTGKLASEIAVAASQYKGGGWAVEAQGPGNYDRFYATFVELGSVNNTPIPFLRQPLALNKKWILKKFRGAFK